MTIVDITGLQSLERELLVGLTNTGKFNPSLVKKIRAQLKTLKATKVDIPFIFQNREVIAKFSAYYE